MRVRETHKAYHHGDLRNALIEAGRGLLREQGVAGLTLRATAKRAGVSHAAPYRHFRDKAGLLAAIATLGFEDLTAAMTEVSKEHIDDPAQQLTEAGVAYVLLAVRHPEQAQLMFGGALDTFDSGPAHDALRQAGTRAFESLVGIVDNGVQAGIYEERDARKLALPAWAIVHGLAMLITAGQLKEAADSEKQVVELARYVCRTHQSGLLERND